MKQTIKQILNNLTTQDLGFPVTYTDEEGVISSYNVFTNDQFRQIAKQLFGMRVYDDWEDESSAGSVAVDFYTSFTAWKATRADTYGRRMYALSIKFNPLENYNGHEKSRRDFTHGENVSLSFTDRKDTTKDDTFVEKSFTNYKETTKDDSFTERSYTDLKETTTDDSTLERTYTNFKETTTDDTSLERTYTNFKETTTDDTSVERTYNQYKETTTDDTSVERTYTQYKEQNDIGARTTTHKVSADDSSTFVNNDQTEEAAAIDSKTTTGSYKDEHGYTNGVEKSTTGSYKDEHGYTDGLIKETSGSYKDEHGYTDGLIKETSGSYKDEHGYTEGQVKETSGSYKDQNGFDQLGNEKSITGTIKDQRGFTNGVVNEKAGTETTAHTGKDTEEFTLDRAGNLGVTTSQQMLASDLDLLRYDITMMAIKEFISTYTFFSLEVD